MVSSIRCRGSSRYYTNIWSRPASSDEQIDLIGKTHEAKGYGKVKVARELGLMGKVYDGAVLNRVAVALYRWHKKNACTYCAGGAR